MFASYLGLAGSFVVHLRPIVANRFTPFRDGISSTDSRFDAGPRASRYSLRLGWRLSGTLSLVRGVIVSRRVGGKTPLNDLFAMSSFFTELRRNYQARLETQRRGRATSNVMEAHWRTEILYTIKTTALHFIFLYFSISIHPCSLQ
ncbi:hypothetical protein M422DRAFT_23197 [Sphaerobolus stellatus SS14]|nr:hypothetical protein M422DRAFT_23197 [Sphaerobolus stellatus SS14]